MMKYFWKDKYPAGLETQIDPDQYPNVQSVLEMSCKQFARRPAFTNLGKTLTYGDLYQLSGAFAAWIQTHTDLKPGDRIAIQLPNVLQYPIAIFGAIRAGLVVVNTNPLYTARELEHQLKDSGASALLCFAQTAHIAQQVLPQTHVRQVIVTEIGDVLPMLQRVITNSVVKHLKEMVPEFHLPQATKFTTVIRLGLRSKVAELNPGAEEIAVLQYTGGTTGVAKGAMLSHRNLIANMLQCQAFLSTKLDVGVETIVAPLPMYHIYAFTFNCMAMMLMGNHNLLITNPRDIPALVKLLSEHRFTGLTGLNTLFSALCSNDDFRRLDFSALKVTVSAGMTLQLAVAERWRQLTGILPCEGYGMTEAAPAIASNPYQNIQLGTVGVPLPSTVCKIIDDNGKPLGIGMEGELCVAGPQVMKGYWNQPLATAEVLDSEGWLRTGDIAVIQEDGFIRIVDRKKDMILVSGFNVYPNELEEVLMTLPEVLQCAAVGVPDERSGEAVKIFVVLKPGAQVTEEQVQQHMSTKLTGYKKPKYVEFRESLPMTNVGKILRRELRDEALRSAHSTT